MLRRLIAPKNDVRPPGPAGLPLLGSLFDARRDPLHFVQHLSRAYGDIVRFRIGPYTGYHLNHPDYIQQILQTNHANYSKANHNYTMLKPVLGEGLLTSTGGHWLQQRRLIQPAFHRERIAHFGSVTTQATAAMLAQWSSCARQGRLLDVADEMMRLTLRIVGESLFSVDTSAEAGVIGPTFAEINQDVAYRARTIWAPPLWIPTPRNRTFKRNRDALDRIVRAIIARRQQENGSRVSTQVDLLDMLLAARDEATGKQMTPRQVRDEVMTLMLAGHETTATLLTWTWYLLATHPAIARSLAQELDSVLGGRLPTVDDLPALPYTERVLQESMRLYPPVWILSRTAVEDDEIGGYSLPAGALVTVSPYTMHRHSAFWRQPEDFDPERFALQQVEERPRYAYFPFGGGPRYCIGASFAMMEARLILATVAQQYDFSLVSSRPAEPEPLVTLRPRHGLQVQLHPRRKGEREVG